MMVWDVFKKAFDSWENAAAQWSESAMKSPIVLAPSASMLSTVLKSKAALDRVTTGLWSSLGLATRRDQERMLHALNQMQSRLMDLQEQLDDKARADKKLLQKHTDSAPRKTRKAG
jgi:hypothetical protein